MRIFCSSGTIVLWALLTSLTSVYSQSSLVGDSIWLANQAPPYDRPVNPDIYLVRQGEILTVTFVNSSLPRLFLHIDAEGKLVHSTLGVFDLRGMTLTDVRRVLQEPLSRQYNVKAFIISIDGPNLVTITVLGAVSQPGTYRGWSSQRVSDIIAASGGLTTEGSSRHIEFSGGPKALTVDLDRARYLGVDTLNPRLYAGHRIDVPNRSHDRVQIVGEVQRPREIELLPGDTVGALLRMAGGMNSSSSAMVVELVGRQSRELHGNDTVSAGDIVGVRESVENSDHDVIVSGEVTTPGQFLLKAGMTVSGAVDAAGGATADANLSRITVFRMTESEKWSKSPPFRYAIDGLTKDTDILSFGLHKGDSVFVPRLLGYVRVGGLVARSLIVPFSPGKSASYYINAVGGFLPEADRNEINLANRLTGISMRVSVSTQVQDGDKITVIAAEVKR